MTVTCHHQIQLASIMQSAADIVKQNTLKIKCSRLTLQSCLHHVFFPWTQKYFVSNRWKHRSRFSYNLHAHSPGFTWGWHNFQGSFNRKSPASKEKVQKSQSVRYKVKSVVV